MFWAFWRVARGPIIGIGLTIGAIIVILMIRASDDGSSWISILNGLLDN